MKRIELPAHIRGVFFDSAWETTKVWSLPTSASSFPMEALAWHLDLTIWSTMRGEGRFDLAPATVLSSPELYPRHWAKIQAADLAYPLEMFGLGGRWVILDGYHRLCRHVLLDNHQVPTRLHPAEIWTYVEVASD